MAVVSTMAATSVVVGAIVLTTAITAAPITGVSAAIIPSAQPPQPTMATIPLEALNAFTAAIQGLQTQMGDMRLQMGAMATRLAAIEGRTSLFAPDVPAIWPSRLWGIPALLASTGPVIAELFTAPPAMASHLPLFAPVSTSPVSASVAAFTQPPPPPPTQGSPSLKFCSPTHRRQCRPCRPSCR